jgi:predicted lipoprotein with Yx(FWY)xxD motif
MTRSLTLVAMSLMALVLFTLSSDAVAQSPPTIQVTQHPTLGAILTDADGKTLYLFTNDGPNLSNCYDQCATNWPPLLIKSGFPLAGEGVPGVVGLIDRLDGGRQVTYNGMPLYYFVKDTQAGDVNGQGVKDVWFVVHPDVTSMTIDNPVIQLSNHPQLGDILTNQGMTLYLFTKDGAASSACYDKCAANWPPLLVKDGLPQAGTGITATLGIITRTDGGRQVTYNGMPLYFWIKDVRPGDASGQGVNDVWFVVHPDRSRMTVADPIVQISEHPSHGPILTNQGMTLYWFKKDSANASACYGQCAINWPPLLLKAGTPQAGKDLAGQLGVIERTDGTQQVTYNGRPLYFWVNDVRPGDTTGHGVNDVWFVATP